MAFKYLLEKQVKWKLSKTPNKGIYGMASILKQVRWVTFLLMRMVPAIIIFDGLGNSNNYLPVTFEY